MKSIGLYISFFLVAYFQCITGQISHDTIYVLRWNPVTNQWNQEQYTVNKYIGNQLSEHASFYYDTFSGNWVEDKTMYYTYNPQQNLHYKVLKYWDEDMLSRVNYQKTEFLYTGNLKTKEIVYQYDIVDSSWTNLHKREYTYNYENKVNKIIYYDEWDIFFNQWRPYHLDSFYYEQGELVKWNHYIYDPDQGWTPERSFVFSYENDLMTNRSQLQWNDSSGSWVNHWKSEFINENNQRKQWVLNCWNEEGSNWQRKRKFIYHYTGDTLTGWISYFWQTGVNDWQYHWKADYMYRPDGQLENILNHKWQYDGIIDSSRWHEDEKFVYNYINDELDNIIYFNDTSGEGMLEKKKKFIYGNYQLTIDNTIAENKIEVYPNPVFNGDIWIKYSDNISIQRITLFNGLGKPLRMMNSPFENPVFLNIQNFHSRFIIIRIETAKGEHIVKKIINVCP